MKIQSILIVDDNEADQLIANIAITDYDDQITLYKAYDGQEALELLNTLAEPPSLLLLDINMPRMGGFEFLDRYKALHDASAVVVMLSSSNQEKDKQKAFSSGLVKHYIIKPLETKDLAALAQSA